MSERKYAGDNLGIGLMLESFGALLKLVCFLLVTMAFGVLLLFFCLGVLTFASWKKAESPPAVESPVFQKPESVMKN